VAALREIVFDCADPPALARFWAAVLEGYRVREYDAAEIARLASIGRTPASDPAVLVDGPGPLLCFQERRHMASEPGRVHLDLATTDRHAEVTRLCGLGARVERQAEGYSVLLDPEGNRFCVVERRQG
jgi:hypothetical protein